MKKLLFALIGWILVFTLAACSVSPAVPAATGSSVQNPTPVVAKATSVPVSTGAKTTSVATTPVSNSKTHEDPQDYVVDPSKAIAITLNGASASASGGGVVVNGSQVTIGASGTYTLSGTLTNGQIIVNSTDKKTVYLVLNGVDIRNSNSAAINILAADKVVIVLAENTKNSLSDGAKYTFTTSDQTEPNAALFSKADLTIYGKGALTVQGNYQDGIASKDGLIIAGGTLNVTAADDGIRGKDYLVVQDGNITINAKGDGLKSDNEEDPAKGYVSIATGTFNITSGGDAIAAKTNTTIQNGQFTLAAGGGSSAKLAQDASAKGIKAEANLEINAGTFNINAADDAVHSSNTLTINGGAFAITTGDDGIHADNALTINNGDIQITKSYEGIESCVITINNGTIHLTSSDDGINAAGGVDGSGMGGGPQRPGGAPGTGQTTTYTGKYYLYIKGGYIAVNANGDGLDINGAIEMSGGVVLVNGPTEQMNGAIDYDAYFKMTGGTLVATGSAGMAMAPSAASSQFSTLIYLNSVQSANTLIHIQDGSGKDILTFAPAKNYQSIAFCSPDLAKGASYEIYTGGRSTGTLKDGLYQGGSYSAGTKFTSFTISNVVTTVGNAANRGGRP